MALDGDVEIQVTADLSEFARQIGTAISNIQRQEIDIPVRASVAELEDVSDRIRRISRQSIDIDVDSDSIRRASQSVGNLGSSVGRIGGLTAAFTSLGAAGAALGASIAPAVGAIAAIPAAAGVATAGIATLSIALNGVGEAFSAAASGDAEEFAEATEDLAPAAREAAGAIRELAPAFSEIGNQVQQAFFADLAPQITETGEAIAGPLSEGATNAASAMGDLTGGLLEVVASSEGISALEASFADLTGFIGNVQEPLENLLSSFFELASAVSEGLGGEQLGAGLAESIDNLAEFISAAAESGEAVSWVEGALEVFSQLGAIIGNVAGILGGVFAAGAESGGGFLQIVEDITGALADFFSQGAGQDALVAVFSAVAATAEPLLGLFETLGPVLADAIGTIASAIQGIMPQISGAIDAIGGALELIVPVAAELVALLLPFFADLLEVITPLIEPIAELVVMVGEFAAEILSQLMPVLIDMAEIFAEVAEAILPVFMEIFEAIAPIILDLVEAFLPLIEAILPPLSELLVTLAELFAEILEAILPIIEAVLPVLIDLFINIMEAILPVLIDIIEDVVDSVNTFRERFQALKDGIAAAVETIQGWFDSLTDAWDNAVDFLGDGVDQVFSFFRDLGGDIMDALSGIADEIIDAFGLDDLIDSVSQAVEDIFNFFAELPDRIWDAVTSGLEGLGDWIADISPFSLSATGDDGSTDSYTGGVRVPAPNVQINTQASDPAIIAAQMERTLVRMWR